MRHEVRPHGLAFLLLSRWDELVCFCPLSSALVEEIVASWDGDRLGRFSFPWLLPLFLFVCVCVCAVCVCLNYLVVLVIALGSLRFWPSRNSSVTSAEGLSEVGSSLRKH